MRTASETKKLKKQHRELNAAIFNQGTYNKAFDELGRKKMRLITEARMERDLILDDGTSLLEYRNKKMERKAKPLRGMDDTLHIMSEVARFNRLTLSDLKAKDRRSEVLTVRQITMFIAHIYGHESLKTISRLLLKDHATVIHSLKVVSTGLDFGDAKIRNCLKSTLEYLKRKSLIYSVDHYMEWRRKNK